jgi:8-amino-7-oxononanoate synthase
MESPPGPETVIDGRRYLYFAGTSYLGLAGHPEVVEAACDALRRYGVHSATTRAGFGHNPTLLAANQQAALFFGTEDAFYFSSGYVSNHILVQAIAARVDAVFLDENAHYCLEEAACLLGRPMHRFHHRSPEHLAEQLQHVLTPAQRPLVMSDAVFASNGALAPVAEYLQVLEAYPTASISLDDAHGFGVLGEQGRGLLEHLGLWQRPVNAAAVTAPGTALFVGGTLGKALGGYGGIVPGTHDFLERTRKASHYYEGASAPPSPAAAASAKAMEIVRREPALRQRLQANIRQCRQGMRGLGIAVEDWPTPIVSLKIGSSANMQRIHATLKAEGILVPYVAAYAGVSSEGHLRCAVCAGHTPEMIDQLLGAMQRLL